MVMLMSDQAHLDADVQALTQATTAVEAEIAALKSQPLAGSLDFSRLDAAVAQLQGDAPAAAPAPAPTPTPEPAPAPAPEPPVTTSQSPIGPPAEPPAPPVSPTV
jgi:ribosomal protein L12E/L44/L45/RPP1/RPP2